MITPRQTRLVRVPDLHAFRQTITALSTSPNLSCAVVVPTRAAARMFERSGSRDARGRELVTRDQLYDSLQRRLSPPPRRLSAFERDALAQAAAESAAAETRPSFRLRPGLVAEMLRFYDQLRRQSQHVKRVEEIVADLGEGTPDDRGAERLLGQTRFLSSMFRHYELRLRETGACDEHTLRERLILGPAADPLRQVIVTVSDWIADPAGLFQADFDLLTRIPGLESIDLIATEGTLAAGFHERIHTWWPGLEEIEGAEAAGPLVRVRPTLQTPPDGDHPWFTFRDRQEELTDVARRAAADSAATYGIVFKQPLPYLYLAPDTLGAAGLQFCSFDALPLAAEPAAAALDLVLECVESDFTRDALIALLRSPHFCWNADRSDLSPAAVDALDASLANARFLGGLARLEELGRREDNRENAAYAAAVFAARALDALREKRSASSQIGHLLNAFVAHLRDMRAPELKLGPTDEAEDRVVDRERKARGILIALLEGLAAAHAAHHDPDWTITDLTAAVRRWIADETFLPESPESGVALIDDQAARYGALDDLTLVGIVEHEWPERPRRNIFYGTRLLKALGWPSERDRRSGADARFVDLLQSASRRVTLSVFTLDDEALVSRSVQLDEVPRARLSSVARDAGAAIPLLLDEQLTSASIPMDVLDDAVRSWTSLRLDRSAADSGEFHGQIGPRPSQPWSVNALETYLGCPFRFFARHILRLEEERDEDESIDPRRQGEFVHDVFEAFFTEWKALGRAAVTPGNLDEARDLFAQVVEREIEGSSVFQEAEAGLERTRLLGSPAAAGLGEAVLRMEAERPTPVVDRLLEHRLDGELSIDTPNGPRVVQIKGKADRLDLLEDGTFRLIDYKLGWPPNRARALQLPIYSLRAEASLAGHRGRQWSLNEAVYLAFKGPRRIVPLFSTPAERADVMAKAGERVAETLDAIGRGDFPPRPDDVFRCETCGYATVCRKDYVGVV